MDTTAGFHLKIGNYSGLKRAHLEHDDDKFNGNEDIDYSLSHLNTNHTYVDNLADFYYEKYEKPIEQVNEKHKKNRQYGRMFKDFNEYKEKQKKSGRRKNYNKDTKITTPPKHDKDENRLMVLQYADKESTDKIIRKFMNMGFTKEEVLKSMGEGMDDFTEEFNSRHNNMKIVEKFTHLDEGYVHSHANLYSYGRDRYGKPYYDINQSLFETYGGTKHQYDKKTGYIKKDKATGEPKKFKKGIKDVWSDFRDETDRSIHAHVNEKLVELAKTKGKSYTPPKFIRKDSEDVGVSHEKHKQKKEMEEVKNTMMGFIKMNRERIGHPETLYNEEGKYLGDYSFKVVSHYFKEDYEMIKKANKKRRENNEKLTNENKELKTENDELKTNNEQLEMNNEQLRNRNTFLMNQNQSLESENEDLNNEKKLAQATIDDFNDFMKSNERDVNAWYLHRYLSDKYGEDFDDMMFDVKNEMRVKDGGKPLQRKETSRSRDL